MTSLLSPGASTSRGGGDGSYAPLHAGPNRPNDGVEVAPASPRGRHPGADPSRTAVDGRRVSSCLLYTSDAADERSSVDLGGRRILKNKTYTRMRERPEQREKTEQKTLDSRN